MKAKGTQLFLKQVISDARCPEGVNCVWGGEAQVLVSVYQNKKWMDEEILTFSSKKVEENLKVICNRLQKEGYYLNLKVHDKNLFYDFENIVE